MKILVTGAKGFVGKNLVADLRNVRDGKRKTNTALFIEEIFEYDVDTDAAMLDAYCAEADFVFHLAGVNRASDPNEFVQGNFDLSARLLDTLKKQGRRAPVMLASSLQASLVGRYAAGEYGKSKQAGEALFFAYGAQTGVPVYVYRLPNLFGKWCRPYYNSVVATFCHQAAHGLPLSVNDPATELELLYIDDLLENLLALLSGKACRCEYEGVMPIPCDTGRFCYVPVTHKTTLGEIASLLQEFCANGGTLTIPALPAGSFQKKLHATYLSYLPPERVCFPLGMHTDARGSFTELFRTARCGQISVNVSRPGAIKGEHWHHSKCELFVVVSGRALIRQRKLGEKEIRSFLLDGNRLEAVWMLPGYTHNVINLSDKEDLVTVIWASEGFDPERPDTFFEVVEQ